MATRLRFAFAGLRPVHLMSCVHAWERLRHVLRFGRQRCREDLRFIAVGLVGEVSLLADENRATTIAGWSRNVSKQHGRKPAVVPEHRDRRLVAARGEL